MCVCRHFQPTHCRGASLRLTNNVQQNPKPQPESCISIMGLVQFPCRMWFQLASPASIRPFPPLLSITDNKVKHKSSRRDRGIHQVNPPVTLRKRLVGKLHYLIPIHPPPELSLTLSEEHLAAHSHPLFGVVPDPQHGVCRSRSADELLHGLVQRRLVLFGRLATAFVLC